MHVDIIINIPLETLLILTRIHLDKLKYDYGYDRYITILGNIYLLNVFRYKINQVQTSGETYILYNCQV